MHCTSPLPYNGGEAAKIYGGGRFILTWRIFKEIGEGYVRWWPRVSLNGAAGAAAPDPPDAQCNLFL